MVIIIQSYPNRLKLKPNMFLIGKVIQPHRVQLSLPSMSLKLKKKNFNLLIRRQMKITRNRDLICLVMLKSLANFFKVLFTSFRICRSPNCTKLDIEKICWSTWSGIPKQRRQAGKHINISPFNSHIYDKLPKILLMYQFDNHRFLQRRIPKVNKPAIRVQPEDPYENPAKLHKRELVNKQST